MDIMFVIVGPLVVLNKDNSFICTPASCMSPFYFVFYKVIFIYYGNCNKETLFLFSNKWVAAFWFLPDVHLF